MARMDKAEFSFFEEGLGKMLREERGVYLMVNAVSRRVRQLQLGERALSLPADGSRDIVKMAFQEFVDDKLEIVPRTPGQSLAQVAAAQEEEYADSETDFGSDDDDDDDEL
jgi:DNA-directed RNA polymerase subunit K/omega